MKTEENAEQVSEEQLIDQHTLKLMMTERKRRTYDSRLGLLVEHRLPQQSPVIRKSTSRSNPPEKFIAGQAINKNK